MYTWKITFDQLSGTTATVEAKDLQEALEIARGLSEIREAVMMKIVADYTSGVSVNRSRTT